MYIDYNVSRAEGEEKMLSRNNKQGKYLSLSPIPSEEPRIFSLRLCTDTFAVSPVGLGVSDGAGEASVPGHAVGHEEELARTTGRGVETFGKELGIMAL